MAITQLVKGTIYERAVMIDSSSLISIYSRDKNYELTNKIFNSIKEQNFPVYINHNIIAETHRRLLYDSGYMIAKSFINEIYQKNFNYLEIQQEDTIKAVEVINKYYDQSFSFCDAITMSMMKRLGIYKVMAYDHHFTVLGFLTINSPDLLLY